MNDTFFGIQAHAEEVSLTPSAVPALSSEGQAAFGIGETDKTIDFAAEANQATEAKATEVAEITGENGGSSSDENNLAAETIGTEESAIEDSVPLTGTEKAFNLTTADNVTPSDGIEILVRMARQKEIDPKAVDIIDVTDRFLKLIAATPKENLRQSGKILFHACVLLRMKAEALLVFTVEDDPPADDFLDFEGDDPSIDSNQPRQITFADLERAIVRKSQRRKVRRRQVTLEELIQALKDAEKQEKNRTDKKPKARIDLAGQHDVEGVEDLLDLAHDEDIESTIERVEQLLAKILQMGEQIELFVLVSKLDSHHDDWVDTFLASLFLSNAGKIDLEQSEFYGPLYLSIGRPSPVADTVSS